MMFLSSEPPPSFKMIPDAYCLVPLNCVVFSIFYVMELKFKFKFDEEYKAQMNTKVFI